MGFVGFVFVCFVDILLPWRLKCSLNGIFTNSFILSFSLVKRLVMSFFFFFFFEPEFISRMIASSTL